MQTWPPFLYPCLIPPCIYAFFYHPFSLYTTCLPSPLLTFHSSSHLIPYPFPCISSPSHTHHYLSLTTRDCASCTHSIYMATITPFMPISILTSHTSHTYPHLTTPPKPVSFSKPSHFSHHLFSLYPTYPSCTVFSLIYTTSYHQPHAYTIISSMPHPLNPTPSNSSPIRSRYFPLAWISTRVGILVSLHPPTIILIPYSIYHTTCPLNLSHYLLAPITIFFQNTHSPVSLTTVIFINESSPWCLEAPTAAVTNRDGVSVTWDWKPEVLDVLNCTSSGYIEISTVTKAGSDGGLHGVSCRLL